MGARPRSYPVADEGRHAAERNADGVCEHVEGVVGAVAEPPLDELQPYAHEHEQRRVEQARMACAIEETEPEHQRAVGEKMAELVAVLEVDFRRRGGERKPDDRRRPSPADREEQTPLQKSVIWPPGEGGRKRLQSSSGRLRLAP